ncbi:MAG: LuxR C-terminal-related transcriptional regulator [Oscillospiraceae bacterium]|nr:LuxR C-terminal-related transcriptional regulator [Oscillospiraceae bacterium]
MSINGGIPEYFGDGIIFRENLIRRIKSASVKKNIFLTAPGGYGKTAAAEQWLGSLRKKSEKILVQDTHNDPGVFYKQLASSLLALAGRWKNAPRLNVSFDGLLKIVDSLPNRNARCYLFIDDLHVLKNEEIINRLPAFAERLPAWLCVCIGSRAEPSAALLETGRFEMFGREDFLFTPQEVEYLGAEKEHELTNAEISDLLKTTGGWAMYLSALLSGGRSYNTAQTLTQYLELRVWNLWDDETKKILLCLSIVPEITPELAERLTDTADGKILLERLTKTENAFLFPSNITNINGSGAYKFHDIFREFLSERINKFLDKNEIYRLNNIAAEWYYEHSEYFFSMKYFYENRDHEGIIKCEQAITVYNEQTENISVEGTCNFIGQYILSLPHDFVVENPFLIVECAVIAFQSGSAGEFLYYKDTLEQKLPEIAGKYPDLIETSGFLCSLDWRTPMVEYAKALAEMMPLMQSAESEENEENETFVRTNTVTQNLPLFHRSMRDYSEIYELKEEDLQIFRDTFGMMIGEDYKIMEQSLTAGIYYERGELLLAVHHAVNGCLACGSDMHPETVFSANMILSAVLYAMGAVKEAENVMLHTERFLESKAQFLRANFKALQTERAIRAGDTEAGKEWLEIYAYLSENLPFYQIYRHFTTLRSLIALGDLNGAADFGKHLYKLAADYNRPLDMIESGILTAVSLWNNAEKQEALNCLEQAVNTAMPYGFKQLFINEGRELLPLLWELHEKHEKKEKKEKTDEFINYLDTLIKAVYKKHDLAQVKTPDLSPQQRAVLPYLSKGMSYREIAEAMGLEYNTVKSHVRLLYKKLNVHNAAEAAAKAKALGLY